MRKPLFGLILLESLTQNASPMIAIALAKLAIAVKFDIKATVQNPISANC